MERVPGGYEESVGRLPGDLRRLSEGVGRLS